MTTPKTPRFLYQQLEKNPLQVVDVGARGGIHKRWQRFLPFVKITAFDPDPAECEHINKSAQAGNQRLRCLPFALGAQDGENAILNICREPGCSSIFMPNFDFAKNYPFGVMMEVTGHQPLTLRRLESICHEHDIRPDCIKIDTQGFELEILRGAGGLLKKVLAVELEVEFAMQYQNQPLFADVDIFMRANGFQLRGLRRTFWRCQGKRWLPSSRGGQLVHGDALYFAADIIQNPDQLDMVQLLKALIICGAYRQDDLTEHLLTQPYGALAKAPENERRALAEFLIPSPPFYNKLLRGLFFFTHHRAIRKIIDESRPPYGRDWHDPDFY